MALSPSTIRTAYDDPAGPGELHSDCLVAEASLDRTGAGHRASPALPADTAIHFEDLPHGLPQQHADMLAAAHRLAHTLQL